MRRRAKNPYKREIFHYKGRGVPAVLKALLALICLGIVVFLGSFAVVMSGAHDKIVGDPQAMVVLGCQVKPWGPSILLQDRLNRAYEWWEEHPDTLIIVTGAQGPDEPMAEARAMTDYLVEKGVPEEQILLDEASRNTLQNLQNARTILEQNGMSVKDGVIIVSNGFHLTRAKMLAARVGYENVSVLGAPSSHLPSRLKMYIREPIALWKSILLDQP